MLWLGPEMGVVFLIVGLVVSEHFLAIKKVHLFQIGRHADVGMLAQKRIERGRAALLSSADNEVDFHLAATDLHSSAWNCRRFALRNVKGAESNSGPRRSESDVYNLPKP